MEMRQRGGDEAETRAEMRRDEARRVGDEGGSEKIGLYRAPRVLGLHHVRRGDRGRARGLLEVLGEARGLVVHVGLHHKHAL